MDQPKKIVGNVVGTPIKPQKVIEKAGGLPLAGGKFFTSIREALGTDLPYTNENGNKYVTMQYLAYNLPVNSTVIVHTGAILSEGDAEWISDWGNDRDGIAYINKGASHRVITMMVLYGFAKATKPIMEIGNYASSYDTVKWERAITDKSATMNSTLWMNSNKISGLAEPTSGTDAATKAYVDSAIIDSDHTVDLSEYATKSFAPGFKKLLTASDDMDNIIENGIYVYQTASRPVNSPFENAAVVMVYGNDTNGTSQKIQLAYRYGASGFCKVRSLLDGAWQQWVEFATKDYVDNLALSGGDVDLSGYAKKTDLDSYATKTYADQKCDEAKSHANNKHKVVTLHKGGENYKRVSDKSGSDDNSGEDKDHAYKTINRFFDVYNKSGKHDGRCYILCEGNYAVDYNLFCNANLHIEASHPENGEVVLDFTNVKGTNGIADVVFYGCHLNFKDVTIKVADGAHVRIEGSSVCFTNVKVKGGRIRLIGCFLTQNGGSLSVPRIELNGCTGIISDLTTTHYGGDNNCAIELQAGSYLKFNGYIKAEGHGSHSLMHIQDSTAVILTSTSSGLTNSTKFKYGFRLKSGTLNMSQAIYGRMKSMWNDVVANPDENECSLIVTQAGRNYIGGSYA